MVETTLKQQILDLIPQKEPFRFVDSILDVKENSIIGEYRFREDHFFYQGHFPGNPITPGVILIEAMAQTGVVAMGISRLLIKGKSSEEVEKMITLFAFAEGIEFSGIVCPGEAVTIHGEMVYYRRGNLKATVCMKRENGEGVCVGTLTGSGVNTYGH